MDIIALQDALTRAIDAAGRCGIAVTEARTVARTVAERSGFPGDLFVLAVAGGTGVGKSSLLNALADAPVSDAGPRRPTTSTPVAWLPAERVEEAAPLLAWLGGVDIRTHPTAGATDGTDGLAILDLPDLDSIERDHAARVDAALPKVDAVLWVSDIEKYQDAVLHDTYLRRWMRRLGRQAMVLNKVDRLSPADAQQLREDLRGQLTREGFPGVPVLLTSATSEVGELRGWLADGLEAKRVVVERLSSSIRAALADLAVAGGVDDRDEPRPLVPPDRRNAAIAAASREVLSVIDIRGLERQAVAATRAAARPVGGGPIGLLRWVVERGAGSGQQRADPEGFLRRWRERGSQTRGAQAVHGLVVQAIQDVPAAARPGLAALADIPAITAGLAEAADRAVGSSTARFVAPRSRLWPMLGAGQLLATGALVLGLLWLVGLWLSGGRPEPAAVSLPIVGPLSIPVALVAAGLLGWFLLGRLLAVHAGWLGRRWARQLAKSVGAEVEAVVGETALRQLESYDAARLELWRATHMPDTEGPADSRGPATPRQSG